MMLLDLLKRLLSYFLPPIVFIILNKLKFGKKQNTPSLNKLYDPTFQPWRFSSKKLKIDNLSGSEKKDLFEFERIREEIQKFSLVSFDRLWILYKLSQHSKALNGDFVECGVYKGGTAFLFKDIVQKAQKKKKVFLFDTFSGMPNTNPKIDNHLKGDFKDTSIDIVKKNLGDLTNIKIVDGFLPDSIKKVNLQKISFLHIDLDIYKSIYQTLDVLYKKVIRGGIIVFDDYGFISCYGARLAVNDFFKKKIEKPICLPTGQSFVIKK